MRFRVAKIYEVEAASHAAAIDAAHRREPSGIRVFSVDPPIHGLESEDYDRYPTHPLAGVPQAVLDTARAVLADGVLTNDVDQMQARPLADAVVARLREEGFLMLPGRTGVPAERQ